MLLRHWFNDLSSIADIFWRSFRRVVRTENVRNFLCDSIHLPRHDRLIFSIEAMPADRFNRFSRDAGTHFFRLNELKIVEVLSSPATARTAHKGNDAIADVEMYFTQYLIICRNALVSDRDLAVDFFNVRELGFARFLTEYPVSEILKRSQMLMAAGCFKFVPSEQLMILAEQCKHGGTAEIVDLCRMIHQMKVCNLSHGEV